MTIAAHRRSCSSPITRAIRFRARALGVPEIELKRHIAWDIGIAAVGRLVTDVLEATFVQQNYSRLVIDCNRPPGSETSIPTISELPDTRKRQLSEGRKAGRVREIFRPYHDRIEADLDHSGSGRPVALIAMHSLTPVFKAHILL
jgi:predicted N-formylglutamate amidohydrolase